ncbi:MAG: hypothetical protein PWP46_572 [Fusobacteriaceae bacterium]|jgi:AcrR family transcriptional regulator|nr:hypothetical protein [Fusobacteriaceae bacterium]
MAKKTVFTKEEILKKSYELLREKGIGYITARNIAKKLNSSPAPIYNSFKSIDELKYEILSMAKATFLEYVQKPYTDKIFLNIGMGIVLFAKNERQLFDSIFLKQEFYKDLINDFNKMIFEEFDQDERFKKLSEEKRRWLLHKCWVYAHGLATLVCTDFISNVDMDYIRKNIYDTGMIFINSVIEDSK